MQKTRKLYAKGFILIISEYFKRFYFLCIFKINFYFLNKESVKNLISKNEKIKTKKIFR